MPRLIQTNLPQVAERRRAANHAKRPQKGPRTDAGRGREMVHPCDRSQVRAHDVVETLDNLLIFPELLHQGAPSGCWGMPYRGSLRSLIDAHQCSLPAAEVVEVAKLGQITPGARVVRVITGMAYLAHLSTMCLGAARSVFCPTNFPGSGPSRRIPSL